MDGGRCQNHGGLCSRFCYTVGCRRFPGKFPCLEDRPMSNVRHLKVSKDDDGQRIDRWLKRHVPELPYVHAQKLLRQGQIRVDSKRAKPDTRLTAGQDIRIPPIASAEHRVKKRKEISDKDAAFIK